MLRKRFPRLRALVGIVVLTLALVAGITGTTEPAAALDMDPNAAEWLCNTAGGDWDETYMYSTKNGFSVHYSCALPSGDLLICQGGLWRADCNYF